MSDKEKQKQLAEKLTQLQAVGTAVALAAMHFIEGHSKYSFEEIKAEIVEYRKAQIALAQEFEACKTRCNVE